MARSLKFWIQEEELYYLCSENKGADQLCSYCTADLRLCFRICKFLVSYYAAHILPSFQTGLLLCSSKMFSIFFLFHLSIKPSWSFGKKNSKIIVTPNQVVQFYLFLSKVSLMLLKRQKNFFLPRKMNVHRNYKMSIFFFIGYFVPFVMPCV